MGFSLRNGVTFCRIDDRLVFLDIIRDRYFCLPSDAERLFLTLIAHGTDSVGATGLAELEALDIGQSINVDLVPRPCPARAPTLAFDNIQRKRTPYIGFGMKFDMRATLWWTGMLLRIHPLNRVLDKFAQRRIGMEAHSRDIERASPVIDTFNEAGRLSAADGDCLLRSIGLSKCLIEADVRPTVVFGIRLDPFSAHCWVQIGPLLIHDDLDWVATYTPILVV